MGSEYSFFVFETDDRRAEKLIPIGSDPKRYRVCGCVNENNELAGYMIFDIKTYVKGRVSMSYIWVKEEDRFNDIASGMLSVIEDVFERLGVKSIFVDYSDYPKLISSDFSLFLEEHGFEAVGSFGKRINYFVSEIENSKFMGLMSNVSGNSFGVEKADIEVADEIRRFIAATVNEDDLYKVRRFDQEYCYYRRLNGKIVGVIVGHRVNSVVTSVDQIIKENDCSLKDLELLVGGTIKILISEHEEDQVLSFRIVHEKLYPMIIAQFGEPNSQFTCDNYLKILN